MTTKEKAIRWFENIAYECDKLTSGNVAHLKAQIKGMAIRSAEYLAKHSQEPASEDLEQAADRYGEQHITYKDDDGYWIDTQGPTADAFKAGAQWQREQMMKGAIDTRIDKRLADMIGYTGSERVKVIIIKE
jgi:hypothetical protein